MYKGEITITNENCIPLMKASQHYLMGELEIHCIEHLQRTMNLHTVPTYVSQALLFDQDVRQIKNDFQLHSSWSSKKTYLSLLEKVNLPFQFHYFLFV